MKKNILTALLDSLLTMPSDIFCHFVFIYLFKLNDEAISNVITNLSQSDIHLSIGDKFYQEKNSCDNNESEIK